MVVILMYNPSTLVFNSFKEEFSEKLLKKEVQEIVKKKTGEQVTQEAIERELIKRLTTVYGKEGFEEIGEMRVKKLLRRMITVGGGWDKYVKELGESAVGREVAEGWLTKSAGGRLFKTVAKTGDDFLGTRTGKLIAGVAVVGVFGTWITSTIGEMIGAGARGLQEGYCADAPDPEECVENLVKGVGAMGLGVVGLVVAGIVVVVLVK